MEANIIKDMLLIEDQSVFKLYREMMQIAGYFLAPVFTIALIIEFFGEMNFGSVVKKLVLISVFMGCFYLKHMQKSCSKRYWCSTTGKNSFKEKMR